MSHHLTIVVPTPGSSSCLWSYEVLPPCPSCFRIPLLFPVSQLSPRAPLIHFLFSASPLMPERGCLAKAIWSYYIVIRLIFSKSPRLPRDLANHSTALRHVLFIALITDCLTATSYKQSIWSKYINHFGMLSRTVNQWVWAATQDNPVIITAFFAFVLTQGSQYDTVCV